jgi:hypothetical protein
MSAEKNSYDEVQFSIQFPNKKFVKFTPEGDGRITFKNPLPDGATLYLVKPDQTNIPVAIFNNDTWNLTPISSLLSSDKETSSNTIVLPNRDESLAILKILMKLSEKHQHLRPIFWHQNSSHAEKERASPQIDITYDDKSTFLEKMTRRNEQTLVALILGAGANPDVAGKKLDTPLHIAAYYGYQEIVALLLAAKAKVDSARADGATPLHLAANNGYVHIVQLLLAAGANKELCTKDGFTPLFIAQKRGHEELVKLLTSIPAEETFLSPQEEIAFLRALVSKQQARIAELEISRSILHPTSEPSSSRSSESSLPSVSSGRKVRFHTPSPPADVSSSTTRVISPSPSDEPSESTIDAIRPITLRKPRDLNPEIDVRDIDFEGVPGLGR